MNLSTSTILIVDDSDEVRTIVRIFLERDAAFTVWASTSLYPRAASSTWPPPSSLSPNPRELRHAPLTRLRHPRT